MGIVFCILYMAFPVVKERWEFIDFLYFCMVLKQVFVCSLESTQHNLVLDKVIHKKLQFNYLLWKPLALKAESLLAAFLLAECFQITGLTPENDV